MIQRPPGVGAFQFVVLSTLRAAQLIRGCTPRIEAAHKAIVMAQFEVAEGLVVQVPAPDVVAIVSAEANASGTPASDLETSDLVTVGGNRVP